MSHLAFAAFLVATLLAGCASSVDLAQSDSIPTLQASATTGVIRTVVIDDGIRPLANATVAVTQGGSTLKTQVTDANGFAGFEGLAPGAYFLTASKARFIDVQQSVDVVAGVDDPPIAKLLLQAVVGDLAFYREFKIEAFMECSAVGNLCWMANYYPCYAATVAGQQCTGNLTNDNTVFDLPITDLQRVPDWVQGEMVWKTTQPVSPNLDFRIDITDPSTSAVVDASEEMGPSPLLVILPPTKFVDDAAGISLGVYNILSLEAFQGGIQAVCDNDPTQSGNCVYAGLALQQRFTYFVHIFYGYAPPADWRFTTDGTVPSPPS